MKTSTSEQLSKFSAELRENGFRVMYPEEINTWIYFEKDGKIGYCQAHSKGGMSFSTVNKPCSFLGSGTRMHDDIYEPTVYHATYTFREVRGSKPYGSLEEIRDYNLNKSFNYQIWD